MLTFSDNKLHLLRGNQIDGQLQSVTPSMLNTVQECGVKLPAGLCMITEESPRTYKKALEAIGYCWKQELRYDFPPFTEFQYRTRDSNGCLFDFRREVITDNDTRSFMWVAGTPGHWQPIGGCTFKLYGDDWWLTWIWLHPQYRRKGHLISAWPFFRSMFGVFMLERPLSRPLCRFLHKVGYVETLKEHFAHV